MSLPLPDLIEDPPSLINICSHITFLLTSHILPRFPVLVYVTFYAHINGQLFGNKSINRLQMAVDRYNAILKKIVRGPLVSLSSLFTHEK